MNKCVSLPRDSLGSWPHPFRGYPQHFSQVHQKWSNSTVELRNRCLLKSSGEAKEKTYHTPYSRNQKHSPIDVFVTPKFLLICSQSHFSFFLPCFHKYGFPLSLSLLLPPKQNIKQNTAMKLKAAYLLHVREI